MFTQTTSSTQIINISVVVSLISFPTRPLGGGFLRLILVLLFTGCLNSRILHANSQTAIDVVNTASGNFRPAADPATPVQGVTSNPTSLSATVAGRPGLELVKTGDRAAAEPGDTVVYRLIIRNTGSASATNITVRDTLPLGLQYISKSQRASLTTGSTTTDVSAALSQPTVNRSVITFTFPSTLAPQQILTLVYAAVLSPDAIRGTGRNLAVAQGASPLGLLTSNTASHLLRIRNGILSDCGTIIGRVFVDKNFDGEQQPGEPGVPNAVIYMDDGNRITTDANGLYSLQFAIAGYRNGTLDLTSLPGYTLAPNRYRIENNSQSRLVKVAPGGLVRMNFAVTPTFGEGRRK